jgi:uncharacterized membrane protein
VSDRGLRTAALVLSVLGIGVAGYLTLVHVTGLEPLCASGGGGCERVQSSEQSELAGVPVALLGLLAYVVLLATTLAGGEAARALAALTALVGFGFSAWLTYQSIAVIEATCQWCLVSAALMTLLAAVCTARLVRGPEPVAG